MTIQIPLRFVETQSSAAGGAINPEDHIQAAVERANSIWSSIGIGFWTRSVERYPMPHLHRYVRGADLTGCPNGSNCFSWATVRDELRQVLPNIPLNAYPDDDRKAAGYWLHAASALYANPNEVLVWLVDEEGQSGCAGPFTGRMVYVRRDSLWVGGMGVTVLAHELGHFMGLSHCEDPGILPPGFTQCDRWDLVFLPGTPNVFFSAAGHPPCDPDNVKSIASAIEEQPYPKVGPFHAVINGQSYEASGSSVDPALKGLFRLTGAVHDPPRSWGIAKNGMGNFFQVVEPAMPRFYCASQAKVVMDHLARDVGFSQENKQRWMTSSGKVPEGALPFGLTSLRGRLGKDFRGAITGSPAVASWGPARLDVFVRADTDRLWHKRYSDDKGWSYWRDLGGSLTSAPTVVSWGPDRLDVFVRGLGNRLAHIRYSDDKAWSGWRDLGGKLTSAPSVVSWAPDRLDVFAGGAEGQLMHIRYSGDKNWSEWRDLGGSLLSAPSVVSWGPSRLDVFAVGLEQHLMHIRYSGDKGWSDWRDLGGRLTSAPSPVSWGTGRLDVFARGFEHGLAHMRYSGDKGWSDWRDLGGRLTSGPSAVSWGVHRLDVFVSGFENRLAHKRYSGDKGWSDWRDLGGRLTSAPSVVSWGVDRLDVFARGFAKGPAHQRYSKYHGWSDWRTL